MILKNLVNTCYACPAQWDAETEDGRPVYIRYRWGFLSIRILDSRDSVLHGEEIYGEQIGDEMDGYLPQEQLLDIVTKFSPSTTTKGERLCK